MNIVHFAELRAQPWRNGGGITREVARMPQATSPAATVPNESPHDWDWRVSIADVSKGGEFSSFPGMERVLTVIDGEQLLLTVDGLEHCLQKYQPIRFSGDATTYGSLPAGEIRDLNVIYRKDNFTGFISIIELSEQPAHSIPNGQVGILLQGSAQVMDQAGEWTSLSRYDAVIGLDGKSQEVVGRGHLAVVSMQATSCPEEHE